MAENNNSAVLETEELTSYTTETNSGAGTGTSTIAPGYGTGSGPSTAAPWRSTSPPSCCSVRSTPRSCC